MEPGFVRSSFQEPFSEYSFTADDSHDEVIPNNQEAATTSRGKGAAEKRPRLTNISGAKRQSAAKGWCFTINNYSDSDITKLQQNAEKFKCYIKYGKEVAPETGTHHLQGYLILKDTKRLNGVKDIVGIRAHLEKMKGNVKQNDQYVEKEGDHTELGDVEIKNKSDKNYGPHFNEIEDAKAAYASDSGEAIEDYFPTFVKYPNLQKMLMKVKDTLRIERLKEEMNSDLKPWQEDLVKELTGPVNSRTVLWVVDPEGNRGKTWLSKYLAFKQPHDVIRFENGKSADLKYAYTGQKVCIYDLSRSQQDHINYEVIESIKNGIFLSTKYESFGMPTAHREMCAGCQRPIEDRFLMRVMDLSWHEHCLQCCICQMPLSGSCFARDRKLYCKIDYEKIYINSAKCSGCFQLISPNQYVMRALDHVYHINCFICVACGHPLQKGDQFVVKHGQLFCRLDYEKEMNMMAFSPKSDDSDSYDDESDSGKPPKRPRTILTTSQRRKFKGAFEMNPKPCRKVRESLAAETGLSVRVVQVWFQNQRAKVKKIARRQTQDNGKGKKEGENGEKNKSKSPSMKKDDDSESDSSFAGNETGLTGFTSPSEAQTFSEQMNNFDTDHSDSVYSSNQPMSNNVYSDSSTPMDDKMDSIDQILLDRPPNAGVCGTVINPIDKLYSMQSSYFSAE